MTYIKDILLFADANSMFSVNILKGLISLNTNTKFYVISKRAPMYLLPEQCYFINLELFKKNSLFKKAIDTVDSLAIAIHATEYAIELETLQNSKKIAIFTGDDTLFRISSDKGLTDRFNHIFKSVDGVGFCSFFHQQEYIPFLESPAFLIPFGYDSEKQKEPLKNVLIQKKKTLHCTIIPPNNIGMLFNKLEEFNTLLRDNFMFEKVFYYHVLCDNKDELIRVKQLMTSTLVDFDINLYNKEHLEDISALMRISDITISFKETYSIENGINILFKKHHPIFVFFNRDYIDFENSNSHVFYYESVIGLAKKVKALLELGSEFYSITRSGYENFIKEHSFEALKEKLQVRIEQIFNNPLHKNHEDTNFFVDDKENIAVFVHFATIEMHRHSARPMRVRAIRDTLKKHHRTFALMGSEIAISKKLNYIKELAENKKIQMIYEEGLSSPHELTSPKAKNSLDLRRIVKKYNLNYTFFLRDMYQAYPVYEKLIPNQALVRFNALQNDVIDISIIATKIFTPSQLFIEEAVLKGVVPVKFQDKLSALPPAINPFTKIYNDKYKSSDNTKVKIVYSGGMGEFYDFSIFLEAVLICENLPIEFHLFIKKEELERSRDIYGYDLDNAPHIFIHTGAFTELAIGEHFDLALCLFDDDAYRKMAVPVKIMDYHALNIPIIAGKGTEAGKIIAEFDTGFVIKNSCEEVVNLLLQICQDKNTLRNKQLNIENFIEKNSWDERVRVLLEEVL